MTLTRRISVALAGLALLTTGVLQAQQAADVRLGQQRTYRWNDQRTGFGFDPTEGATGFEGTLANQMPAYVAEQTIRSGPSSGQTVQIPNPDLQWYFPMDVEGASLEDNDGNSFPIGYALDEIHSSPTVGSLQYADGSAPFLTVTFGSSTTVRRDIRNSLPPSSTDDMSDGRAGVYTTGGAYNSDRDPYSYLQRQQTGAIFSIEAFGGTREEFEAGTNIERRFKPLWWYGVRNLPFYRPGEVSLDPTNPASDDFRESPSELQHRFFINASDSAMRAFDYSPSEARNPEGDFGPEPANGDQVLRRQRLYTQYLEPDLKATGLSGSEKGEGYDTGAGWVGPGRPDLPERVTDRLYNLRITAPQFGLFANSKKILGSSATVDPVVGPVDNRFRQNNGMGAVNSTGLLMRLPSTGAGAYAVTYDSRSYPFQADNTDQAVQALQKVRRDPDKMDQVTRSTDYLYIVGSDDGTIYALDADPRNSRRVPETGGGALLNTYMGRVVWAFRAAVRAPLYTYVSGGSRMPTAQTPSTGESPGVISGGAAAPNRLDPGKDDSAIVVANGGIVSGPIVSSPAGTVINVPSTASILTPALSGQNRAVVYVGSEIGRLFCLDAATGQEIWEFKTTPRGQTMVQFSSGNANKFLTIDGVTGNAINSAPTLGFVPGATSQLRPAAPTGRLAVFFSSDDGKVYALDAADGSPLRAGGATTDAGWDVPDHVEGGTAVSNGATDRGTRYQLDHFGFVTYAFERGGNLLPSTALDGKNTGNTGFGRRRSTYAKPLLASVVARPVNQPGYTEPLTGVRVPAVDMLFIASPTNQADAAIGNDPAFTGGTLFAVDPLTAKVQWTFDRWEDVTRDANTNFDKDPASDRFIRPGAFNVTPAYATKINIFNDADGANGGNPTNRLEDQNVLFLVDGAGHLFALKTDDTLASINRLYWRVPFSLPSNPGQSGDIYSSPVVSTPNQEGNQSMDYFGTSFVFVGVGDGIVAVSTTALRSGNLTDVKGQPLAGDLAYTGGDVAWAWTTPRDSVVLDEDNTSGTSTYVSTSESRPVVTTPAIHMGYVWAGADNGLLYAWRSTEDGFGWGASGGRIPYRGGNRIRRTIPDPTGTGGPRTGDSTIEFYVDVFQAGFNYETGFSPQGVRGISPIGAPLASGTGTGVTPKPVGEGNPDFQKPTGGTLEWGDPVAVVAWGKGLDELSGSGLDEGRVTFQLTGPSTSGSLQGAVEKNGTQAYSRQIFYLNPFGGSVPTGMRYPGPVAGQQGRNPLANQILPPGWRGQSFTVTAYYQGPDYTDEQGRTRRQAMQRAKVAASTKFFLANPLNISAHFDGTGAKPLTVGSIRNPGDAPNGSDAIRNGNERVPVVASMIGDHGTATTLPQDTPQYSNFLRVADRSNLPTLRDKARGWGVTDAELTNLVLRVRVQPQRLRWMGGPQSAYKPMLIRNTQPDVLGRPAVPNGLPLPSLYPPEPLYAPTWGFQRASFWEMGGSPQYVGSEQPPFPIGEENRSLDYPDIDAPASSWIMRPNQLSPSERDASSVDAPVPNVALFYLRAAVPKYQPANYSPPNYDPSGANAAGVGPGYYTVNPTNKSATQAAVLGWNPAGRSNNAGPYGAFATPNPSDPTATQRYWGPLRSDMETSSTMAAQEPNYLTKVYVDVNGNGSADVSAGEAYRMFVAGVQVRPDERLRVATTTISVPNNPEQAIPGGFIPFQYYWDGMVPSPGAGDRFLFGERNLYAPFDVYNNGNVNLWSVRLSKYDPMGGHLLSPDVDPSAYAGADTRSNWPASGVIKRFNLASSLDPLPVPLGDRGAADDPTLWTPATKPRPSGIGDEGLGQRMLVKDVFAFQKNSDGTLLPIRGHVGNQVNQVQSPIGRPYLTVAIPPGTTPGTYATEYGRLVLFEDSGPPYASRNYNGILDMNGTTPVEPGVNSDSVVTVRVAESRLTDKVSRYAPFLPQADLGVAMAAEPPTISGTPSSSDLAGVWQRLAQDATPSAYRDPATGNLVVFWSSNRVGEVIGGSGFRAISPFSADNQAASKYHVFATAMQWNDPLNPPIDPTASVPDFLQGTVSKNPWGWQYQGGNEGNFFFPNFTAPARWFGEPQAGPWIPSSDTVNAALGLPNGTIDPGDLTYTSPAVITDFHGTSFPPVVFWTGSTGVGPEARSAIFYAPVRVAADGTVSAGEIQAVGVTGGQRTLDPFIPKFGPRPFLITVGGSYSPSGARLPESYLGGEKVIGLGVAWFGGAPGAWKLQVSTIETDNSGNVAGDGTWQTTQLPLPGGVASALHPSVYYHQLPKVVPGNPNRRYGILEVAFTGYSRSGRNPDIYLSRYIAARGGEDWQEPEIGNWQLMGFARQGGTTGQRSVKPLDALVRVAGEPRPVYRSNWAAWQGRGQLGTTIYWFRKPVSAQGTAGRLDDFELYATFTARRAGNEGGVIEAQGRLAQGGNLPNVTAFVDTGGGTVRFATTDPVNSPAPLSRPYMVGNTRVQDFVYVAMNPYAMRVTTDDQISDTVPQVWLDETHEAITDPKRTNATVSARNPLNIRRDRLWVLWRRAAQPEGATRVSSLYYKTFRLGVELGAPIRLVNGRPDVTVSFLNNDATAVDPLVVDAQNGRIFFTSFNDGDEVEVTANGANLGEFTVGWIPENTDAPARYGIGRSGGETFRLPLGQWVEPRVVPTLEHRDDTQPWMFKDPYSDIAPGTPEYYARGNNNMWLFWSSTRPSRSMGGTRSNPMEPDYWDQALGMLMYAGSAADVYYTTLSPDFTGR